MNQIVVGVDGSDASVGAARLAGQIARASGAKITAVYVAYLPVPATDPALDATALEAAFDAAERQALARVAEALDAVGVAWTFHRRSGEPAEQLELAAREQAADLLAVGARRHTVVERLLHGSVSDRLIHHADRPVLLARDRSDGDTALRHVLVGTDGSEASVKAVTVAGALARDIGAALTVMYVRAIPPGYSGPPIFTPGQLEDYYERHARRAAARAARALAPLDMSWTWATRTGDPAETLDLAAEELGADLLVVGCRGLGVVGRALLDSASTRLARHARPPVLVAR